MAETAIMAPSAVVAAPAAQLARLWFMALANLASAQTNFTMPLWPDKTPGAHGDTPNDVPTISAYFPDPDKATLKTVRPAAHGRKWLRNTVDSAPSSTPATVR